MNFLLQYTKKLPSDQSTSRLVSLKIYISSLIPWVFFFLLCDPSWRLETLHHRGWWSWLAQWLTEQQLSLLIQKAKGFCTLCEIESPTIVIVIGGNAMDADDWLDAADDLGITRLQALEDAAEQEDCRLRELNESYLRVMEGLKEIRRRWLERRGW